MEAQPSSASQVSFSQQFVRFVHETSDIGPGGTDDPGGTKAPSGGITTPCGGISVPDDARHSSFES